MTPSLLAILARFGGDRRLAWDYCTRMATENPSIAKEYWGYKQTLEATCRTTSA